jgi:hypothetical protein
MLAPLAAAPRPTPQKLMLMRFFQENRVATLFIAMYRCNLSS